ncbi:MAG TPA: PQQ-binding-like beta-propeller repeat protein [Verrucomicrobiae bacterium]
MNPAAIVYVGIKGSVLAFDQKTGARYWETALKGYDFVSLLVEGGFIFAGTHGHLYCLDKTTGQILWHDGLRGKGYELMSLATSQGRSEAGSLMAEQRHQEDAAQAQTNTANTTT